MIGLRAPLTVPILLLILAGACSDSEGVKSLADTHVFLDLAPDQENICLGSPCSSADDCAPVTDCLTKASCEAGCCVYSFAKKNTPCTQPCYESGKCSGDGKCNDLEPVLCPEEDGNPCTTAVCDPTTGACAPDEEPIADGVPPFKSSCWNDIVCLDGEPDLTNAKATDLQLQCQAANDSLDPFGCLEQIACIDSEAECVPFYKSTGTPCWTSAGSADETCFGRSCDDDGMCLADDSLNISCSPDSFPEECGEECQACTELTCHWIPDPAKPDNPKKKVPYCRPQAVVAAACSDGNDCTIDDVCVYDSEADGPLGKETLGLCLAGEGKTKEECLNELELPILPCLKKGIECNEEEGCVLNQEAADQWCYPPPTVCFDQDDTFCTHLDMGDNWDPETGCNLVIVDDADCDDGNPCTTDECDPEEGCVNTPNSTTCDDGNPCTIGDICAGGICTPGALALVCDDNDPCTADACLPESGCVFIPSDGATCDDGDPCTGDGICNDGQCLGAQPIDCDDGELCTDDSCDALLGCQHTPNQVPCDDGDPCTENDACNNGACSGDSKPMCCGNGQCEAGEACACVDDCQGEPCDTDECVQNQTCQANGTCGGGQVVAECCGDGVCTEAEKCSCVEDCLGETCNDGNPDTSGDTCNLAGQCAGVATSCGPLNMASNGLLGDLVLSGNVSINTTSGTISDGNGTVVAADDPGVELFTQPGFANGFQAPKLRVFHFNSLTVSSGTTVTVSGSYGLALLTLSDLTVAGTITAAGGHGNSGSTNQGGTAGGAGPGGHPGGAWQSGIGCVGGNGLATGPGAGQEGGCGGFGGDGMDGYNGGGGGGGGGACGGTGGGGGGHAETGGNGNGGNTAGPGTTGYTPGSPGAGGAYCQGTSPSNGGLLYSDEQLASLFGGTGGSGGGFGGFAGFGGDGKGNGGTGYGGAPGFSGGSGGGGGGGGAILLCAGATLQVAASGKVDVHGGNGGTGGGSGMAESGDSSFFGDGPIGGGGGGGRSGGGGGGGGGAGGAVFLAGGTIQVFGNLNAAGGIGGSGGWSGGGGFGGSGKNGGGSGGKGGEGGLGGAGGNGAIGYIRLEGSAITMQGTYTGHLTQQ